MEISLSVEDPIMGSIVIILPIGFVTIFMYFIFSPKLAGWFTWTCLAVWNLFSLYKSFLLYTSFKNGGSLKEGEVLAMASQPFVSTVTLVAILCLLFLDFSKIHLLWFYPTVSLIFDFTIGRRAIKKLEALGNDPFEH